ncbi:hypothetical protein [Egbenema bharatensis]|uniref:hypothetical protein n=1 Tax=Egbenema bharatensis TaxID=3463334 RepID=UPI003A8C861C
MKKANFYHLASIFLYLVGSTLPITSFLATRAEAQGFAGDILKEPAAAEEPRPVAPPPPEVDPGIYEPPPASAPAQPAVAPGGSAAPPPPPPPPRPDPVLSGQD